MSHLLLIHSSPDGHPGSFYLLAVLNYAAVNIGVQLSVWDLILLDKYRDETGLLGHVMVLVLVFCKICTLFPQQLHDFAFAKIAQGYQIFHILNTSVVFCCTHTHTRICHPILHRHIWFCILLWFWFAFPWWLVMLSIFPYTCWSFVYLLFRNVYSCIVH